MRLSGVGLSVVRGGRVVFSDIGFTVSDGELLAVTGPNGAGKSTLLRLIAGLLLPEAGTIAVEPKPDDDRGETIHYLGHLDALKPTLTVRENLAFWRRMWGAGDVDAALDAVGLGHLDHLPAGTLSAGQQRRVAIARILIAKRPVWLLDEPTASLDAASEATLGTLIRRHLDDGGLAIVATHRDLPAAPSATLRLGVAA